MKWFDNIKREREVKQTVIDSLNDAIINDSLGGGSDVEDLIKHVEAKRKIKMNGVDVGDIVKVVANIAVVMVLVGFEMGNILNQKGSRFIKTL